ncbi:MAG: ABC transporter substrate-binding protein [Vicinamibacteria bacterium]|nr:ABC transporter substrate-binding protein [Vicinamibacteria bacterium]
MRWRGLGRIACLALFATACERPAPPSTLVILNDGDVVGLDPHRVGAVFQTHTVLANVYEGLVAFDAEMAMHPALAEAWSNPDDDTWDFRLRPGVRFHDGQALEAEDVVFSFRRALDGDRSLARTALGGVVDVQALPGGRVRLRTAEPDATLVARLRDVAVVSRRAIERQGEAALAERSAGTGPYQIVAHRPGEQVELRRFEGHWRGVPTIERVRFVARSFGAADAEPLAARAPMLFWAPRDPALLRRARAEWEPRVGPGLGVSYLGFDLHGPRTSGVRLPAGSTGNPFLDVRVREAIALALDIASLPQRVAGGEALVARQLVAPVVAGFDGAAPAPRRDLEAARRQLAAAGFADGFEVDLDLREQMAEYAAPLVADLAELGLQVRPRTWPDDEFFARVRGGRASLYVLRFSCRTGDAQELLDRWVHSKDPARGYGQANYSYDANPVPGLDDEIEELRPLIVPAERMAAVSAGLRRVGEARLAVPLLNEKTVVFADKALRWTPRADTFFLAAEVGVAR